jgi:hypothetical protein
MIRWLLILTTAFTFWLLMMAVHEGGHALGAWATGGRITRVILSPFSLSRTDVSPNPSPLTVVWCGPLVGAAFPALLCAVATLLRWPLRRWLRAFAGFCLVVNGLYIASGVFVIAGDTDELLRLGVGRATLGITGLPPALTGLWLWHRLGPQWGLASAPADRVRKWACLSIAAIIATACLMLVISGRSTQ